MGLNIDELRGEAERLESKGGNKTPDWMDNFVIMPDKNGYLILRILPPTSGSSLFCRTRIHRLSKRNLHCPREFDPPSGYWKGDCVACDYYSYLWKRSEDEDEETAKITQNLARSIKPNERYYYNVIVRRQVDPKTGEVQENVGPKILSVGTKVHKMIVRAIVGDAELGDKPLGDITDFAEGRDMKLTKEMTKGTDGKMYPSYGVKFEDPEAAGDPDSWKDWLGNLHNLDELRVVKDQSELKDALKEHLNPKAFRKFDPTEFEKPGADLPEAGSGSTNGSANGSKVSAEKAKAEADEAPPFEVDKVPTSDSDADAIDEDEFMDQLDELDNIKL